MTTNLEIVDHKRKTYRAGYILAFVVFFAAWITRSILKIFDLEMDLLESILMVVLILAVLVQAYFVLRDHLLKTQLRDDPSLKDALNDELVQLNELKAWRVAFFSIVGYIILAGVLSLFVMIDDPMLIYITALLIGFGAYNSAAFLMNR